MSLFILIVFAFALGNLTLEYDEFFIKYLYEVNFILSFCMKILFAEFAIFSFLFVILLLLLFFNFFSLFEFIYIDGLILYFPKLF